MPTEALARLKHLSFAPTNYQEAIDYLLANHPKLERLDLQLGALPPSALPANLHSLDLNAAALFQYGDAQKLPVSLKKIEAYFHDDTAFEALLTRVPDLEGLVIKSGHHSLDSVAKALRSQHCKLWELTVYKFPPDKSPLFAAIESNQSLRELTLRHYLNCDADVNALARIVSTHPTLESLTLTFNAHLLTVDLVRPLFAAIKNNRSLRTLDLNFATDRPNGQMHENLNSALLEISISHPSLMRWRLETYQSSTTKHLVQY